jgi:hypothetical protein
MWGMVEGRNRPRPTLEPFPQFGIAGKRRRQDLHRDYPVRDLQVIYVP